MAAHVSSRHNPLVGRFKRAMRGDDSDRILLDGEHLVDDALSAGVVLHEAVVLAAAVERPGTARLIDRLSRAGVTLATATAPVMSAISPVQSSSAVVALAERPADRRDRLFAGTPPLVVIADGVQDPGNVGAIVRVAEAGGASGVVVTGGSADPFGWKALRGSMGSALRLPTASMPTLAEAVGAARARGLRIVASATRGGDSLYDADLSGPLAVLIGSEGAGLSADAVDDADLRVTIPMSGQVESLNAAITTALIVYEVRRRR